ncbi:MAG: hypothetical protein ACYDA2_06405 [Acidimicrobiales bacterium]
MGVALSLPRAGAVTDELLAPITDVAPDAAHDVRERIVGALRPLAAEIPGGTRFVLDRYRLETARNHPERCSEPDAPFAQSAATCRRAVGLAAVQRCVQRGEHPAEAVAAVLRAGAEDGRARSRGESPGAPWWAAWYDSLAPGGRATVAAEAVTWATQLWTALDWDRMAVPPVIGRDEWWDLPGASALSLRGRADVRGRVDGRPVLLVVAGGAPGPLRRADLLFPAVVSLLAAGPRGLPGRVMGLWPASGQVRVAEVDVPGLEQCGDAVVAAVATWVDGLLERQQREPSPS